MNLDNEYEKWTCQHRKEMGWQLQYEEKYDFGRAAFIAGYELAKKEEREKQDGK